jgi:hypothetical protein
MCPVLPDSLQEQLFARAKGILEDADIRDAHLSLEPTESRDSYGIFTIRTSVYSLFSGLYLRDLYTPDQQRARSEIRALCSEMCVQYKAIP